MGLLFRIAPFLFVLLALTSAAVVDPQLKAAVTKFLETPFVKAAEDLKANINDPAISVEKLLHTPFVTALKVVVKDPDAGKIAAVQKFLETPLINAILNLEKVHPKKKE